MYYNNNDERIGFVAPFLIGALAGGAVVGVSRPRPVVTYSTPYPYYYYNNYNYPY